MTVLQTVNISTNIHNERIKTKYIPTYSFENEGKIFKKLKKLEELELHKLLVGECLLERKASVNKNALVCIY